MKKKRGIISIVLISIIAVIFIIPLVYMVSTSLKPKSEVLQDTISLIGSRVTTENYERAWNAFPFARYMFNSIFVGLATTALTVFTSAMAAYAFARLKFKGRDKVFFVYLSTLMVPIQVTIIPLYMILRMLGWHDSYAALIVPPVFSAFGVFMLRQFFLTIPAEIEEAAKIDGCSRVAIFLRIILPMSKTMSCIISNIYVCKFVEIFLLAIDRYIIRQVQNPSYRFICVQRTIWNRLVSIDGCDSNQYYTWSHFLYNFPEISG